MSVTVFDVAETREYTLKADTEDPTTWIIGRVDHRLWSSIQDKYQRFALNDLGAEAKGTVSFDLNARNDDFVRFGIKGWRNLKDKQGNDVAFSTESTQTAVGNRQGLADRMLEMIRPFVAELAAEIEAFNGVTRAEQKN